MKQLAGAGFGLLVCAVTFISGYALGRDSRPRLSFSGEPNTGIYTSAEGQERVVVAGRDQAETKYVVVRMICDDSQVYVANQGKATHIRVDGTPGVVTGRLETDPGATWTLNAAPGERFHSVIVECNGKGAVVVPQ